MAEFKRNAAREAAAIARGTITKEELERRGGINASGYYGDSYNPNTSLSDEEYAAAIAGKTGLDVGKSINAALESKGLKNNPVITSGSQSAGIQSESIVTSTETGPTTNIQVLKAALRNLGFSSAILDSSTSFLTSLLKEGLDYDNATEIFLNNRDYTLKSGTKVESPFYTEYGFLNEGLIVPKSAEEIFNAVEGYKEVVDKYSLSKKYLEKDSLKNYVKNNVTTKDLAERANIATLKSVNQDPAYVEALQRLGFISTAADLKDFFMDSKIGQEQLNINRTTGAFAAEAIRRAQSGIQFNSERFKAISQTMVEKGVTEEGASTLAAQGFENIAAQLGRTTQLSAFYETPQAGATAGQIQSELEKEEFLGLESERRKRVKAQEEAGFRGTAGTTASSLRGSNVLGII